MRDERIDRAFRRYQQTGVPAQLAIVFDATAQELFRLAWHLIGDRHAAEDLVQSTFLAAIETARTFAPDREVLPWLCGILANRARDARRRRRQHAAADVPQRLDIVDPAQQAGAAEVSAVVGNAIRALPEPYRQVLLLHLEHGLAGKQIAETLSRPEPTARSQIQRGLDLLRAALPPALSESGEAPPPRHDLHKVRAAVLGSLGRVAVVTTLGAFTMKKILLAAGAAAIAVVCAWPWLRPNTPLPGSNAATTAPAVASALAETRLTPPNQSDRTAADPTSSSPSTSLDVLVRWSGGQPANDVVVWYVPSVPRRQLSQRTAITDANGHAHFEAVIPGSALVRGDRGGELQVNLAADRATSLVLDLERGLEVSGRVVDEREAPIGGADIWLATKDEDAVVVARSASDGTFSLRGVAENSTLCAATPTHFDPLGAICVAAAPGRCECVLRMVPGAAATGTVLGLEGQPIAGATVLIERAGALQYRSRAPMFNRTSGPPMRLCRTDARGEFLVPGLPLARLRVWAASPNHAAWFGEVETRSAINNLTITLGKGAVLHGRAFDHSGGPAPDTWVTALAGAGESGDESNNPSWATPMAHTDGQGNYRLDHVTTGPNRARARRGGAHCATTLSFGEGEERTWDPRFGTGPRFHGVVVDPAGQPLERWQLQAKGEVNQTGQTDALGRFDLEVVEATYDLSLVPPDSGVCALRLVAQQPRQEAMRIVVPLDRIPSSRVSGELRLPDGTAAVGTSIALVHLGADGSTRGFRCKTTAAGGRFTSILVFPGRYVLRATAAKLGTLRTKPFDVRDGETLDVGVLQFAEPGSISVRLTLPEGLAVPKRDSLLFRAEGETEAMGVSLEGDTVKMPTVQPGTYILSTWSRTPACAVRVEVTSGLPTTVDMQVPNGVSCELQYPPIPCDDYLLLITFRDATGAIAYECGGRDDRRTEGWRMPLTIAAGRYTVTVTDASGRSATSTVDIKAAQPPLVVTLPTPPAQ